MKKIILFVLVLITSIGMIGMNVSAAEQSDSVTLEGPGYDTPEEAVIAYLDAMNQADIGGMLSTFAMESLIEHLDVDAYLRRLNSVSPTFSYAFLPVDEYAKEILLYNRYAEKARSLYQQYLEYTAALNGMTLIFREPSDFDEYYARFESSPFYDLQGNVKFMGWVSPVVLTEGRIVFPTNKRQSAAQYLYTGADDLMELAAHICINGTDAIQLFQCVRYGERWYIQELWGMTGNILGIYSTQSGLLLASSEEDRDRLYMALSSDNLLQDEQMEWDALRASNLGGSRWQLIAIGMQDVNVYDLADSAVQDAGLGLCAELHFLSVGGAVVRVQMSPALCEALTIERADLSLAMGWSLQDGALEVSEVRSIFDKSFRGLFEEQTAVAWEDDVIIFTLPNGMQAVFQKL